MTTNSIMVLCDAYKLGHRQQYPIGTTKVFSNLTPRSSRNGDTHIVFFGFQAFLDRWMEVEFKKFFETPRAVVLAEYEEMLTSYLGPDNNVGSEHIGALHDLGYVPLEFRALPEGTRVPIGVPVITVTNTHPDFFWLVNYFETLLSTEMWLSCTSATTAYKYRKLMNDYAKKTGANMGMVQFQGHDFSMRGMEGVEAAEKSGAAHLLSFAGTDTVPALGYIRRYYGDGLGNDYLVGASVNATEHAVMMSGGKEGELDTLNRLLDVYPTGILSIVSDTWDLWKMITEYLPEVKDRIMERPSATVIRPDSGDPADILCGDPNEPEGSPANKGVIQLLWEEFGGTINEKGYKVLDPHIGAIYGDSITLERCEEILSRLEVMGFVSSSSVFGIGSFTYQHVTRDTLGFAMKATWVEVNGESRAIFKDPVTDKGDKKSARGLLAVRKNDETKELELHEDQTWNQVRYSELQRVWRNGNFEFKENFQKIRTRLGVQS